MVSIHTPILLSQQSLVNYDIVNKFNGFFKLPIQTRRRLIAEKIKIKISMGCIIKRKAFLAKDVILGQKLL